MRLAGKSAIVTGSARGIGAAFAQALAAEGAKVLVADVLDGARTVEAIQKAGGSAQFFKVDVSDSSSARAMAEAALSAFGQIDILVNNAAIFASLEKKGFLDIASTYQFIYIESNAWRWKQYLCSVTNNFHTEIFEPIAIIIFSLILCRGINNYRTFWHTFD